MEQHDLTGLEAVVTDAVTRWRPHVTHASGTKLRLPAHAPGESDSIGVCSKSGSMAAAARVW